MTLPQYQHEIRPLNARQLGALMADLNPSRIANRAGQGRSGQLSYLEAYDVKATLTKVFGFGGWSARVTESKVEKVMDQAESGTNAKWTVMCSATMELYIHQLGSIYSETAVSSQGNAQVGEAADFAMKTAESDALKRCAINLGTQFGLSLYNSGSTNDVIKVILADGQEWPPLNPDQKAQKQLQEVREIEYISAIIDGVDPAKAREEIWGAPAGNGTQQAPRQATPPEGSAQTPEQYAESQALVQRALTMRAQQATQQEEAQGIDFAALAQQDNGQAAVLSSDPVPTDPEYGGSYGKSEGMAYDNA